MLLGLCELGIRLNLCTLICQGLVGVCLVLQNAVHAVLSGLS